MKILQIITIGHEFYGAQKHVLQLSEKCIQDNHEILVIVGTTGELTDKFEESNIPYIHVPQLIRQINPITDFKAIKKIANVIRDFQPHIVAQHSSKAGILGRIAAKQCDIPSVFTAHGWSFEEGVPFFKRNLFWLIEKFISEYTNANVIAVSNLGLELAISKSVIKPDKARTIYYGIRTKELKKKPSKSKTISICMVAGLREQKDHQTLIEALNKIKERDWKVYLLGDGPLKEQLQKLVYEKGMENKIHFTGAVKNVEDYLSSCDIKVLSTHYEGLPISIIEALSFGIPVIATNVSGVSEEVIDGYNGITVKRKNIHSLSSALSTLIDNENLRKKYGMNSLELYNSNFTIDHMYNNTINYYKMIIRK